MEECMNENKNNGCNMQEVCNDQKRRRLGYRKSVGITYSIPIGSSVHSHINDIAENEEKMDDDDDLEQDFDLMTNENESKNNSKNNRINDNENENENDSDSMLEEDIDLAYFQSLKHNNNNNNNNSHNSVNKNKGQECTKSVSVSSIQSTMSILSQPACSYEMNNSKYFGSFNLNNASFIPTLSPICILNDKSGKENKKSMEKLCKYERVMTLYVNEKSECNKNENHCCDIMGILNNMSQLTMNITDENPNTNDKFTSDYNDSNWKSSHCAAIGCNGDSDEWKSTKSKNDSMELPPLQL